jgi:phospholipid N-methyltransferase
MQKVDRKKPNLKTGTIIKTGLIGTGLAAGTHGVYKNRDILQTMWRNPYQMGEIAPFSQATISVLLKPLQISDKKTIHILEVGAGAGGISEKICEWINNHPNTNFSYTIIEIEPTFETKLKDIVESCAGKVLIEDFTQYDPENKQQFDFIISTIPEQIMPSGIVEPIHEKFDKYIQKGAIVSRVRYVVKYVWLKSFLSKKEVENAVTTAKLMSDFNTMHKTEKHLILWNIPPTYVYISTKK